MATPTIQEILAGLQPIVSNENNDSFIELMAQIGGNPSDAIDPADDPNIIYGKIVEIYNEMTALHANDGEIMEAVQKIIDLTVSASQLGSGSAPTAVLTDSNIYFGIPKGVDGSDGLIPVHEFSYNPTTGDLEVTVTNYIEVAENIEEW